MQKKLRFQSQTSHPRRDADAHLEKLQRPTRLVEKERSLKPLFKKKSRSSKRSHKSSSKSKIMVWELP